MTRVQRKSVSTLGKVQAEGRTKRGTDAVAGMESAAVFQAAEGVGLAIFRETLSCQVVH